METAGDIDSENLLQEHQNYRPHHDDGDIGQDEEEYASEHRFYCVQIIQNFPRLQAH